MTGTTTTTTGTKSTHIADKEGEEHTRANANEEEEEYLPEHTRSMRMACSYCEDQMSRLRSQNLFKSYSRHHHQCGIRSEEEKERKQKLLYWKDIFHQLEESRQQNYDDFWNKKDDTSNHTQQPYSSEEEEEEDKYHQTAPYPDEIHIDDYIFLHDPQEFRQRYHNRNLPCIVNGLSQTSFQYLDREWRQQQQQRNHRDQWFLHHVGSKTLVPLRYNSEKKQQQQQQRQQHDSITTSLIDEEGRATECQTHHVTMEEWLDMLKREEEEDYDDSKKGLNYYLKDWHLQSLLEQQQQQQQVGKSHREKLKQLYETPAIFEYDLLNGFQTTFTNGDYRFCYFGPRGSETSQHSDVMHSFSWSYNVVGTKRWTFYCNNKNRNNNSHQQKSFTLIQKSGQAVFVPATWHHSVINLEETISINHNWITTANIDLVWDLLKKEIGAIHQELMDWSLSTNYESCEVMLLGCVGLNITSCALMMFVRLLDLLCKVTSQDEEEREQGLPFDRQALQQQRQQSSSSLALSWDIRRLSAVLYILVNDESIHVQERFSAVLQDEEIARRLIDHIRLVLNFVHDWSTK